MMILAYIRLTCPSFEEVTPFEKKEKRSRLPIFKEIHKYTISPWRRLPLPFV
jgi:hypothetical protein